MAMHISITISDHEGPLTGREERILAAVAGANRPADISDGDSIKATTPEEPEKPAPKRRGRPPKAKPAEEPKPEPEAAEEVVNSEPEPAEEPEKPTPKKRGRPPKAKPAEEPEEAPSEPETADLRKEARSAAVTFLNANSREELEEILKRFSANRIPDVAEEDLRDFINALETA